MSLANFDRQHRTIVQRLLKAKQRDHLTHSWIFSGDKFDYLESFVAAWIQVCLCRRPHDTGDACGKCSTCIQVESRNYPYLYELKPLSKSRQILVDEIRDLERPLYLTSNGQTKVAVIHEADRMMIPAQNAFLKTLEEPPLNTLLILVTVNPALLLPTIRSRCQTVSAITNRINYEFSGREKLWGTLAAMSGRNGAVSAIEAAEQIIKILEDLRNKVKSAAKSDDKKKRGGQDTDHRQRKKIEEQQLIVATAHYLAERELVFSAIHSWYAQEFMRAVGLPEKVLPHKEFYRDIVPTDGRQEPIGKELSRNLIFAENLIDTLRFNVDEKLAVQEFCLRVCAKSAL